MSPDRDSGRREDQEPEPDEYEVDARRSIFSALWFRAVLVILALGVIAAVAVPYMREVTTQPAKTPAATRTAATPVSAPAPAPVSAPAPTTPPAVTAPISPTAPASPVAAPAPAPPKPTPAGVTKIVETPPEAVKEAPKATSKRTGATAASKAAAPKSSISAPASGPYWVQVGAFKEPGTAKRVAARLREQGFHVEQSTTTKGEGAPPAAPSDRYNVLVSNAAAADVSAKLAVKGMTSESTAGGVLVQPSLPLREAIVLSRDLAEAGLSVQVRRTAGPAPRAEGASSGETLHRVRVVGFADRAAAAGALKALQAKGFTPFIGRGNP